VEALGRLDSNQERRQVASQVEAAIDEMTATTRSALLVIGKLLGSLSAPVVAHCGLAAVWFTPLLADEPTVAALCRATASCLPIGGTADKFWDGQTARFLSLTSSRSTAPITACSYKVGLPPQSHQRGESPRTPGWIGEIGYDGQGPAKGLE
jgi:hypothetical protein